MHTHSHTDPPPPPTHTPALTTRLWGGGGGEISLYGEKSVARTHRTMDSMLNEWAWQGGGGGGGGAVNSYSHTQSVDKSLEIKQVNKNIL